MLICLLRPKLNCSLENLEKRRNLDDNSCLFYAKGEHQSFALLSALEAWEVISEVIGFKVSKTKQKATKTNLHSLVCPLPYNSCLHDGKG
jgi:hypothetical protein